MVERETTVGLEKGLHARPAVDLVKMAKGFGSEINVTNGKREGNAKSMMNMTAFARKGEKVVIRAEGDDAEEAVEALVKFISAKDH